MTEAEAWDALSQVVDPELGLDIVELGLVYRLDIDDARIGVTMTLTTAGCPLHDVIVGGVERALTRPGGPPVDVEVVFDPPWTPEMIGAEGRRALGAPEA
ncbi:MAG: metal-sulfur cluster assembly factor [Actinomycetota bacterium]